MKAYIDEDDEDSDWEWEDTILDEVSGVYKALFVTHLSLIGPIVKNIWEIQLKIFFQPQQTDDLHRFALCLVDDIIEFVPIELTLPYVQTFANELECHTNMRNDRIRQAAAYGLGILAQKLPCVEF